MSPTAVTTGFDRHVHGFRFPNRFAGGAVVAELTRQGRLSDLTEVRTPRALRHLADVTRRMDFWGSFGLCGGMSWAALDRYFAGGEGSRVESPAEPGNELFSELVGRQIDSMRQRELIGRCLKWQILPDRTPWWWFWSQGVHQMTASREWPALRSSLDGGSPESITLIRVAGVADPSKNHQVVATGYEELGERRHLIRLYDPNHPVRDTAIDIELDPKGELVTCSQTTGEPLRGFFVWPYQPPS